MAARQVGRGTGSAEGAATSASGRRLWREEGRRMRLYRPWSGERIEIEGGAPVRQK